jgi:hypothetical protein
MVPGNRMETLLAEADGAKKINRVALLKEIKQLYADVDSEVLNCWKKTLPKMMRLGEALTALKDDVDHGQWISWFKANEGYCGFSLDSAENYMKLFKHRDLLNELDPKSEQVRNLTDALLLIKEPDPAKRKALLIESATNGKTIRENVRSRKETKRSAPAEKPEPKDEGQKSDATVIDLEVCSKPSKPQPMTGTDVLVPESLLQHREHLENGPKVKVPLKNVSGMSQRMQLAMLISLLADQFAFTLDSVEKLKIACNASCQTKGALEHLIHLVHLSWEPLNRIADHITIYVAPDPEREDPDYMI